MTFTPDAIEERLPPPAPAVSADTDRGAVSPLPRPAARVPVVVPPALVVLRGDGRPARPAEPACPLVPFVRSSTELARRQRSAGPQGSDPVSRTRPLPAEAPPELSKRAVVRMVLRRGGPKLLEASVIPGVLFYACLVWGALGLAYISALVWTFGCLARHLIRRRGVPTVLILGAIGITIRTALAVGSGSQFVYFFQPILGTLATGGVFLVSVFVGRPMIGRLAGDFWLITPEMAENPRVHSLFRGLTVLWAAVNLATATVTFVLLLRMDTAAFVATKQVSGMAITASAVAVTIVWSHRTACREGIVSAAPRRRSTVSAPA